MRIKLNLTQLKPNKNPAIYWFHIDITCILVIKQLKEKIQKVLREPREIELSFDDIPFLDEDDIFAINENEEITVTVKERNNYIKQNNFKTETVETDTSIAPCNGIPIADNVFKSVNDNESSPSSILPKNSKKRIRKRTHKKKNVQLEPFELVENDCLGVQAETHIAPKEPNKMHKRFKLDNEKNNQQDHVTLSDSSVEDILHVTREVVRCNSSPLNSERKYNAVQPVWKKEKPLKTKVTKVPIFVRGQTCTPKNSTQNCSYNENENTKHSESNTSEDCDILVVDWKDMSSIKISSISELQIHDLLQFKILSMSELGEPAMSSVITARLEYINERTLVIEVLSGIKEFTMVNLKFRMNDEEDIETRREIGFEDLFELVKLI